MGKSKKTLRIWVVQSYSQLRPPVHRDAREIEVILWVRQGGLIDFLLQQDQRLGINIRGFQPAIGGRKINDELKQATNIYVSARHRR